MTRKTIGILGGMGPAATVEVFSRIVNSTNANVDSDHVNTVIINDPQIPDRTAYILGTGESPIPKLKENLNRLYKAGADVAIMPCMTAHTFISQLQIDSSIPIVNGIKLVEQHLMQSENKIEKIGLLATTGSIRSKVFQKFITKDIVTPTNSNQVDLMNVIYGKNGIKAGNLDLNLISKLSKIIETLTEQGAQAIIAGCTELGLVLNDQNTTLPVIDPISLLAEEAIRIGINFKTNQDII